MQGEECGANLPGIFSGHEHFGFLDGVSQPGVRGRLSAAPNDVLTVRQNPNNRQQGKPGQELIWPGEFVFGYPGQEGNPDNDPRQPFQNPGPVSTTGPDWANDGSFLVFRRLTQDVAAFHDSLRRQRDALQNAGAPADVTADLLGARCVGRWRSGAPVERTRNDATLANDTDNADLGNVDCANNNFEFQESAEPLRPTSFHDPFDCTDADPKHPETLFPQASADSKGAVCPFTGHIRKVYPRDDEPLVEGAPTKLDGDVVRTVEENPETGAGEPIILNEDDTQSHRILRRGIPFGAPLTHASGDFSTPDNPANDDGLDRGLHFLAYQISMEDRFEFIIKNWVNNPDFKEDRGMNSSPPAPEEQGGGHDPIIGQNNKIPDRIRSFTLTFKDNTGTRVARRVDTDDGTGKGIDWVIPTGGGYFFAPSIHALRLLASPNPHPHNRP